MMTKDEIENIYMYHTPVGDQPNRYNILRSKAKELAYLINSTCPDSREKSLALTQLQSTIHWANTSIALNPTTLPNFDSTNFS